MRSAEAGTGLVMGGDVPRGDAERIGTGDPPFGGEDSAEQEKKEAWSGENNHPQLMAGEAGGEALPHDGLAAACARRFLGRGVPLEDLLQEARMALCMAEQRFDPSRGLRFSTYAVPVILGALRAYCRNAAPMHVPRQEQRLLAQARAAREGTSSGENAGDGANPSTDGESPGPEQLCRWLQVDTRRLAGMLEAAQRMQSMTADPELAALAREEGFEERVLLRDAVRRLGQPYAGVIGLRYLCGLTQREVGKRLGAPQWQVCRWEKLGLGRLRQQLG